MIIVLKDFKYYNPNIDESFEGGWHSVLAYGYISNVTPYGDITIFDNQLHIENQIE